MKMSVTQQKMVFGFLLLVILATLIIVIAVGKVEQQTSYGLEGVIGALATLAGAFGNWAFGHHVEEKADKNEVEDAPDTNRRS